MPRRKSLALRFAAALLASAPLASVAPAAPLAAQLVPPPAPPRPTVPPAEVVRADIRYLSDERLGGRMTGSPGADSAAAYLARRFAAVGLQRAAGGWFQSFAVGKEGPVARHAGVGGKTGRNVIGLLPGRDATLRNEIVVVGAHYDHLGLGEFGSLDPDSTGKVHNGADDNASGAAALVRIAARLAEAPPARTVVFIAFGGEELGLLGSTYYVRHPVYPIERTAAMVNLDMVGRLRNDRLIVFGAGTARAFPALLDSLNRTARFDLRVRADGLGPSDHSSFYAMRVPVLHLFTDLHEDYHRTTDDWQKVNFEGLLRVAEFTVGLVRAIADRPARPGFIATPPRDPHATPGPATGPSGYGAYLGTIPDMTEYPGGVRLSGVRAGSPAERAGLRRDDVITRIGDVDVPDLDAMARALRRHRPGDQVEIVVRRGETLTTLRATLGSRGG